MLIFNEISIFNQNRFKNCLQPKIHFAVGYNSRNSRQSNRASKIGRGSSYIDMGDNGHLYDDPSGKFQLKNLENENLTPKS